MRFLIWLNAGFWASAALVETSVTLAGPAGVWRYCGQLDRTENPRVEFSAQGRRCSP